MKNSAFAALMLGLAATACSSGVDVAKQEMAESCVSSANGRLTESECACMTDAAFASLNDEERAFIDDLYELESGASDQEAADAMGMDRSEFDRLSRSYMNKVTRNSIGNARQCVGA